MTIEHAPLPDGVDEDVLVHIELVVTKDDSGKVEVKGIISTR